MKKLSRAICLSSLLMSATAAQAQWEWNFLVGASAGYADRSGDLMLSATTPLPDSTITEATRDLDDSGFIWGILGGLQAHCSNWLFGVEVNADWRDFDDARAFSLVHEGEAVGVSSRFDRGTVIGLTGRAGYQVAPYLMPYIRLGAETSNDELSTTFSEADVGAATIVSDRRSYRFVGGLGLEVPIPSFKGLSIRAEYNYHGKGRVVTASGLDNDGDLIAAGYKPKAHSGRASIVYNFI